jgi:hypothetical protein
MVDVRLTATNPDDSSVVPVSCTAAGLLRVEPQVQGPPGEDGEKGDKGDKGDTGDPGQNGQDGQDGRDGRDGEPFSGTFDGDVTFNGDLSIGAGGTWITYNANVNGVISTTTGIDTGYIRVNVPANYEEPGNWFSIQVKDNEGNLVAKIYGDGGCSFASGKAGFTAEGYLWCTTRRGDTVILEATSQGMGIWESYSPPARIQDLTGLIDDAKPM